VNPVTQTASLTYAFLTRKFLSFYTLLNSPTIDLHQKDILGQTILGIVYTKKREVIEDVKAVITKRNHLI
jgi:hypothetical protein